MSSVRYRSGEGELIPIIVLIIINIVVYLAINIASYSGASVIQYLALSRATVMAEPWTILTSMFTHMDFMHLLANMVTLYFYGSFLNRITGTRTFLWIYFGGGLLSALAVLLLSHPTSFTIGDPALYSLWVVRWRCWSRISRCSSFLYPCPCRSGLPFSSVSCCWPLFRMCPGRATWAGFSSVSWQAGTCADG
jgi:membrane associated rhomboid family serine protease